MGGTEILLVNLLNHLVEKECDITLLLPNPSDKNTLLNRVSSKVPVKYIFPRELTGLKKLLYKNILIFFPRLYVKLVGFKESDYDEVVCFKDSFYSILFSKLKLPKYLWIQNHPFERDYSSHNLKEWVSYTLNRFQINRMNRSFDKYDEVICVSDSSKKSYINLYHGGKAKREIRVLYNALDLSSILDRAQEPVDLPVFTGVSFIVVIRLSYEKTVDRIILASDRLKNEGYDFNFLIVGDGDEFDRLQNMISEYKINDRIQMLGRVANPFPYMKRCDWFLCPSSRESFALTLLESTALGTPVITTDCGGPEDVIERGKYGILTENSSEGVYTGMKKVMDDPSLLPYFVSKTDECMKRFDYHKWLNEVDSILGV
ncbi:glycosyltransferase involved in cell wall biosynthesis [Dysgonomonas alginatilytica]|uniref:Glycosyltransferase involved in cell wall biosynthesis n=1 Tax=Dysgonomonas alginatilytica TaxID=1605892 RepID=A0A2V3PSH2_9BACT|nr:glycosyltransferase [Dysgonomonas alginatilytica]PXV65117.1 glycosyltransferase involved in cell wall biosynthesis [Dysgonomonas alginatilytica]